MATREPQGLLKSPEFCRVVATPEPVLAAALVPPRSAFVERGPWPMAVADERAAPIDGLYLSLTTITAYRSPLAAILTAAIAARLRLRPGLRERIETGLYEAIMNAVVHGNLGLAQHNGTGFDGLEALGRLVEQRLGAAERALKRVRIEAHWDPGEIEFAVCDEGEGYVEPSDGIGSPPLTGFSGRGLIIIRAMAERTLVCEEGRCLCLVFSR
jgi:anti-sigma regulatory factor (Ser/Thr protein kinase)